MGIEQGALVGGLNGLSYPGLVSSRDLHLHCRKSPAKGVLGQITPPLGGDVPTVFHTALFESFPQSLITYILS